MGPASAPPSTTPYWAIGTSKRCGRVARLLGSVPLPGQMPSAARKALLRWTCELGQGELAFGMNLYGIAFASLEPGHRGDGIALAAIGTAFGPPTAGNQKLWSTASSDPPPPWGTSTTWSLSISASGLRFHVSPRGRGPGPVRVFDADQQTVLQGDVKTGTCAVMGMNSSPRMSPGGTWRTRTARLNRNPVENASIWLRPTATLSVLASRRATQPRPGTRSRAGTCAAGTARLAQVSAVPQTSCRGD
jgi:hypothetical protein